MRATVAGLTSNAVAIAASVHEGPASPWLAFNRIRAWVSTEPPRDWTLLAIRRALCAIVGSLVDGLARPRWLEVDDVVAPERAPADSRRDVARCAGGGARGVQC